MFLVGSDVPWSGSKVNVLVYSSVPYLDIINDLGVYRDLTFSDRYFSMILHLDLVNFTCVYIYFFYGIRSMIFILYFGLGRIKCSFCISFLMAHGSWPVPNGNFPPQCSHSILETIIFT